MVPQKDEPLANYELNSESFATLESIKEGAFPKLDKIISEALRIFNKEEDVADDKNKKGGKAPPAPKKDEKKGAKKGGKDEVEEKSEPTKEEIEMKKAVNTEKAIFRYRVNIIKTFAIKKLR